MMVWCGGSGGDGGTGLGASCCVCMFEQDGKTCSVKISSMLLIVRSLVAARGC